MRLFVHQIQITRDYKDSPDYLIVQDGDLAHPLMLLSEFEAVMLREGLTRALDGKPCDYGLDYKGRAEAGARS